MVSGDGTPLRQCANIPREAVIIRLGNVIKRHKFYKLVCRQSLNKLYGSEDDLVKGLDAALRKAVHDQMLSDAPVGAFLSGGLDSTSIVTFAKELDPAISCYTIDSRAGGADGMADDLPYAKQAAQCLGVNLEVVEVDSQSLIENLSKWFGHWTNHLVILLR